MSEYTADVDGIGALRLLNAVRACGLEKHTRLYQVRADADRPPPCMHPHAHLSIHTRTLHPRLI